MVTGVTDDRHLRIGELSRRSGVSPELLRAWERRYGLLRPERSSGGLRLYSPSDLERVRVMRRHMAEGLAAREAADLATRATVGDRAGTPVFDPASARAELRRAIATFDEPGGQAVIDSLLAATTVDALLSQVLVPYLRELGEGWERGEISIAQEHFASHLLRGRLLGLARGWGRGTGPRALLACPPGERHDLGLIAFGLALRERGWRIDFLGGDTPAESIADAARAIEPGLVVVSAVTADPLTALATLLEQLAQRCRVAVAGAGAHGFVAPGVLALTGDPVAEADRLSAIVAA
jgi:DNA-binding transcriptional MerR regulator/methylmalonyl-CoA mutase cobalamin-binding subunit